MKVTRQKSKKTRMVQKINWMYTPLDLKALREAQGLSAEELAKKAGVHIHFVTHIEKCQRVPWTSLRILKEIARALGIDWTLFFPADKTPTPVQALHDSYRLSRYDSGRVSSLMAAVDGMTVGQASQFLADAWSDIEDAMKDILTADKVWVEEEEGELERRWSLLAKRG